MTALISVWSLLLCAFAVIYLGSCLKQTNFELELTNSTEPTPGAAFATLPTMSAFKLHALRIARCQLSPNNQICQNCGLSDFFSTALKSNKTLLIEKFLLNWN